jgi:hypothetical protein
MSKAQWMIIQMKLSQLSFFKKEYVRLTKEVKILKDLLRQCNTLSNKRLKRVEQLEKLRGL